MEPIPFTTFTKTNYKAHKEVVSTLCFTSDTFLAKDAVTTKGFLPL